MGKRDVTERFLNSIGIENVDEFDVSFESSVKSIFEKDYYDFTFSKETPWTFKQIDQFLNGIHRITTYRCGITFVYSCNLECDETKNLINEFYFNSTHQSSNFRIEFGENNEHKRTIFIKFKSDAESLKFKHSYLDDLKSFLNFMCYNFDVEVISEEVHEKVENINEVDREEVIKEMVENFQQTKKITEDVVVETSRKNYELMLEERRQRELFKKGDYQEFKIAQLDINSGAIDINGKIFEVNVVNTRNNRTICKIGIDDGTDAIYASFWNDKNNSVESLTSLTVGQNIRVKGRMDFDNFRNEAIIRGHYFYILPEDALRDDFSEQKRVELHLHTKMSDMDGVSFFKDYVKVAKNMGHKAIAITDHGNVQGFPDAQAIADKAKIKVLYGSEIYVIDDDLRGSFNCSDVKLEDATYVCYDTETTGLSTKYDRVTEFGAVKVVKGVIVDRLDILINPERRIPKDIEEKTNITNEMVSGCPTFKEVWPQIRDFIGDSVLVTHNAVFDYDMLNQSLKRNGLGELKNAVIDTLALFPYLFPDSARHNLGALCNRYDVEYDTLKAHRADYDAEVLANCWLVMRQDFVLKNRNVTVRDLEHLPFNRDILLRYRRDHHAVVLAKNYDGVKELYQIISESHVNTMGYFPFVTKSFLKSHRKNLLVGSACFNGEVFDTAMLWDEEKLREAIRQFDYIEIQPLENYSFLINDKQIPDNNQLIDIIKTIIRISKEEHKLICATGDCHYVDPKDKVYRDVIISALQVGNRTHPLYPRDRTKGDFYENPDQHYRSTTEMLECFSFLPKEEAYEYVVTNTNKIADMIDNLVPVKLETYNPEDPEAPEKLTKLVYENAHRLYGEKLPQIIEDRIKSELNGIISNGFSTIYWIAHLLVKKANDDGYVVGSRGSVGSSLVATLANITEVNPLAPHYRCPKCCHTEFVSDTNMSGFDLKEKICPECGTRMVGEGQSIPFQTFLGFHAEKTPDIDLNFATDYQSKAHDYTKVLLGANNVYRAGTISTVQSKTAFGYVRKYFEEFLKMPLTSVKNARIASLASGCTEIKRTTGQHPAGIVVVPEGYEINDFTPIQYPAEDTNAAWKTTHFDFTSMHDTLLKLDILGHVDPQAIKMLTDMTGINPKEIPMNDPKVLSLFTSDEALNLKHERMAPSDGAIGLPEFGTDFVRGVLHDSKPKTFKDLVIVSGLTHGTNVWNGNAQTLLKDGTVKDLSGVIGCRDDIMVYLMSMGVDHQDAFTIMETVRKKDKYLKPEQIKTMMDHGVPKYYIDSCNKIEYLFPKGHATAYVMMAIRVAYFKVYYPLEYYAHYFTMRSDAYDIFAMSGGLEACYKKLEELKEKRINDKSSASTSDEDKFKNKDAALISTLEVALELYERGYKIEKVSIEKSMPSEFIIDHEHKSLIPSFKVLDGMGESGAEKLINARKEKPFTSKKDIMERSGLSQTVINQLEELGSLDNFKEDDSISLFDFSF